MYDTADPHLLQLMNAVYGIALLPAAFAVLYGAHYAADYWLQTQDQSDRKGLRSWAGRLACARHVATHTACNAFGLAVLVLVQALVGLWPPSWSAYGAALLIIAVTHYWADRRFTLAALCAWMDRHGFPGKIGYYQAGGAVYLDQAWHLVWLVVAAAVLAVGTAAAL